MKTANTQGGTVLHPYIYIDIRIFSDPGAQTWPVGRSVWIMDMSSVHVFCKSLIDVLESAYVAAKGAAIKFAGHARCRDSTSMRADNF